MKKKVLSGLRFLLLAICVCYIVLVTMNIMHIVDGLFGPQPLIAGIVVLVYFSAFFLLFILYKRHKKVNGRNQ